MLAMSILQAVPYEQFENYLFDREAVSADMLAFDFLQRGSFSISF